MNKTKRRFITGFASSAVLAVTAIAPAIAGSKNDDGEERGDTFTSVESFLLFFVTPVAFIALTTVFVYAPSWMAKAKSSARGGFLDDPTLSDHASNSKALGK